VRHKVDKMFCQSSKQLFVIVATPVKNESAN